MEGHAGKINLRLPQSVVQTIEIGDLRASGSLGLVYDVTNIGLKDNRKKVIKIFRPMAGQVQRMYLEVRNCSEAKKRVPTGTVEVLGCTEALNVQGGPLPAIVFVDGGRDLASVMDEADDALWASYMKQALCVVASLYRKGICHGDIKPANMVVDDEGKVTLIDFGSATFAQEPGGRSPTSRGPTSEFWCPISRMSSMSTITGISFPGIIDGTQDGFVSDSYSCAVSFGKRYGLSANSISGVRVPTIDELGGGLSAAKLTDVMRGLTAKACQRWDIDTLEASPWWREVQNMFCVQVPPITDAEKARAKRQGRVALSQEEGGGRSSGAASATMGDGVTAKAESPPAPWGGRMGNPSAAAVATAGDSVTAEAESSPAPRGRRARGGRVKNPSVAATGKGTNRVARTRSRESAAKDDEESPPAPRGVARKRSRRDATIAEVESPPAPGVVSRKRSRRGTVETEVESSPAPRCGRGGARNTPAKATAAAAALEGLSQPPSAST